MPITSLVSNSNSNSLITFNPDLVAIFNKSQREKSFEFWALDDSLIRGQVTHNSISYLDPESQRNSLMAHHCLDNSAILSHTAETYTLDGFLRMIYDHCDVVIMLMQARDFRHPMTPYFKNNESLNTKSFTVTRKNLSHTALTEESTLEISPKDGTPVKSISHHHYNSWVDNRAADAKDVAKLARIALSAKKPLIHCVAGQGRSGTLAAVISAYRMVKGGYHSADVIQNAVDNLRKERPNCVATSEQYLSIYDAVKILLQEDRLLP